MAGIRILLTAMPQMLTEIVLELAASEPAVGEVARLAAGEDVVLAAARFRPDVVVMSAGNGRGLCEVHEVLYSAPRARVLLLSADGRDAQLARLVPEAVVLHDISAGGLLDAVVGRTGSEGETWTHWPRKR